MKRPCFRPSLYFHYIRYKNLTKKTSFQCQIERIPKYLIYLHRGRFRLYWSYQYAERLTYLRIIRLRLGNYSTIFTEPEAISCFSIIAQLISNSFVNSFCFWNHSVTFVMITRIEISSQFPPEFNGCIQYNQQNYVSLFWKVLPKLSSIFCALRGGIFFYCVQHFLCNIDKMRGSHFEI